MSATSALLVAGCSMSCSASFELFSVAFCSPAKSSTFSGFMENPLVGKKLKSERPSRNKQNDHSNLSNESGDCLVGASERSEERHKNESFGL